MQSEPGSSNIEPMYPSIELTSTTIDDTPLFQGAELLWNNGESATPLRSEWHSNPNYNHLMDFRRSVSEPPGGGYDLISPSRVSTPAPAPQERQPIFQRRVRRVTKPKKARTQPYPGLSTMAHTSGNSRQEQLNTVPISVAADHAGLMHGHITSHLGSHSNSFSVLDSALYTTPMSSNASLCPAVHLTVLDLRNIIAQTVRETLEELSTST